MSNTAKIMSLMSRPEVKLMKTEVVERVRSFGLGVTSYYYRTGRVDLPRMVWLNLKKGTEVWVMGTHTESSVIRAEMLFFPDTQRCLDLTHRNRPPIVSAVGLFLAGLVFLVQNIMFVLYYYGLPTLITVPLLMSVAVSRTVKCSVDGWELLLQSESQSLEMPLVIDRTHYYPRVRGILAVVAWLMASYAIIRYLVPVIDRQWALVNQWWNIVFSISITVWFCISLVSIAVSLTLDARTEVEWL